MVKFTVMSREQAKDYTYSEKEKRPYIIISINDVKSLPNMFKADPMLKGTCFVYFNDVDQGSTAMKKQDAKKILRFVNEHIFNVAEIIVHCGAGVSRSAGVCAALMKILTLYDNQIFDSPKYKPNMHCYRMVLNAYFGMSFFGSTKSEGDIYSCIAAYRDTSDKVLYALPQLASFVSETRGKESAQDVCADKPSVPKDFDVYTDKTVYNQKALMAQKRSEYEMQKAVDMMTNKQTYVICIKKVADIYGKPLDAKDFEYEYAQLDTRNALSRGYPDWGPEAGAMRFESDVAAAEWFAKNKKHLMSYKQQYDWSTLAIRQVSYSYIALTCEDPEPDELEFEQAKDIIAEKQKESEESARNAAAGYDEGYYDGLAEGYEKALEILNKVKI